MINLPFTFDSLALWILLVVLAAAYLIRMLIDHPVPPSLAFSNLEDLKLPTKRLRLIRLPRRLYQFSLLSLGLAFLDPHVLFPKDPVDSLHRHLPRTAIPVEGIAIYLVLDQSGSMNEKIASRGLWGRRQAFTKLDFSKEMSKQFILQRPSDLIGLVAFARIPKVISPLTLDQDSLLGHLEQLKVVQDPEENGTAMGYAIYKTAHLIAATRHFAKDLQEEGKPAYDIKNAIMIVLTDGFQDPNRLDYGNRLRTIELEEAAAYAKSQGIHVYIINIDPQFSSAGFAPHRRQMQAIAEMTGGQLYLVSREQDLLVVFDTIDRLEKDPIPIDQSTSEIQPPKRRFSLYPYLIAIGLSCFLAAFFLESTLLRKFP